MIFLLVFGTSGRRLPPSTWLLPSTTLTVTKMTK
ncbi:hypothetical protein V6Z12_A05G148900 [Gossypium hirsutum]